MRGKHFLDSSSLTVATGPLGAPSPTLGETWEGSKDKALEDQHPQSTEGRGEGLGLSWRQKNGALAWVSDNPVCQALAV